MTLQLLHSEFLIYEEIFISFLSVHQVIYLSQSSFVSPVELTEGKGGDSGVGIQIQPNYTTAKKLGPIKIIQYSQSSNDHSLIQSRYF
jgi:hypothetical protein